MQSKLHMYVCSESNSAHHIMCVCTFKGPKDLVDVLLGTFKGANDICWIETRVEYYSLVGGEMVVELKLATLQRPPDVLQHTNDCLQEKRGAIFIRHVLLQ